LRRHARANRRGRADRARPPVSDGPCRRASLLEDSGGAVPERLKRALLIAECRSKLRRRPGPARAAPSRRRRQSRAPPGGAGGATGAARGLDGTRRATGGECPDAACAGRAWSDAVRERHAVYHTNTALCGMCSSSPRSTPYLAPSITPPSLGAGRLASLPWFSTRAGGTCDGGGVGRGDQDRLREYLAEHRDQPILHRDASGRGTWVT